MRKKSVELSAQDLRAKLKEKPIKKKKQPNNSDIDFSDIPDLSEVQLKSAKRAGRPLLGSARRKDVHLRVDPDVLERIKEQAKKKGVKYQSLINEILKKAV